MRAYVCAEYLHNVWNNSKISNNGQNNNKDNNCRNVNDDVDINNVKDDLNLEQLRRTSWDDIVRQGVTGE